MRVIYIPILILASSISSCDTKKPSSENTGEIKANNAEMIGNWIIMPKNLNVSSFRNGDIIPEAKTDEEWKIAWKNNQPAWCYYENDPTNGKKYGKLYNWIAVNDPRGLAPVGWHIPSNEEWTLLIENLGGGTKSGEIMKSTPGWFIPAGRRTYYGKFERIGIEGFLWTSSWYNIGLAWQRKIFSRGIAQQAWTRCGEGLSVRCIKY